MTKKVLRLQKQINKQLNRNKKNKAKRWIILSLIVLFACLAVVGLVWYNQSKKNDTVVAQGSAEEGYDFYISFLDVGEGNACLVQCDGEAMLIDTGYYEFRGRLEDAIKALNIDRFKVVCATHPDADHIGSIASVLSNYEVQKVLMPDAMNDTVAYNKMLEGIDEKNIPVDIPGQNYSFALGRAEVKVLSLKKAYEELNDYSIVLKIEFENKSFMIMGDASKHVEEDILASKADVSCDVLLLGHHGSSDSTSEGFLKKANPVDAVISCGKDNDYGHPHKEVLKLLEKKRINCYRTDQLGNINYGIRSGVDVLYRLW